MQRFRFQFWATIGLSFCGQTWSVLADGPADFMIFTQVNGQQIEGQPLAWNSRQMLLLGRDGELHEFPPAAASKAKKFGTGFRGYSMEEMKERLQNEFGRGWRVTGSQHFLVVHAASSSDPWAERLEQLYRSFIHYMSVRGFRDRRPQVPLVAIVYRNEADYYAAARASGQNLQPGMLGHYDPGTNRVLLYDARSGGGGDWSANADTIIHEATHQTAYNVGVHRRFADQPRWLVEGLAMMFEAPGVWTGRSTATQADRLNRGRLGDFRYFAESRAPNTIVQLVGSDQLFRTKQTEAYAEAWMLSFFLCETRPQEYCRYLAEVADRPAFSTYSAQARLSDFARYFGGDFKQLNAEMLRFVEDLP